MECMAAAPVSKQSSSTKTLRRAPEASWHRDHADSAYIYIGGLEYNLSEGDIVTIFSQFGEPTFVKLIRDKETGKSKGFAYLKYEDQRSTDLAVDNLGGATVRGRLLKVDHTRYKKRDDKEDEDLGVLQIGAANGNDAGDTEREEDHVERPLLKEEKELAALIRDHEEDDPMKEYLVEEKKAQVAKAVAKWKRRNMKDGEKRKHGHHHKYRSQRNGSDNESDLDRRRHKHYSKRPSSDTESDLDQRRNKHRSRRISDSSDGEERRRRHRSDRRRSRSPR
ncbi:MAG: hypothetical protein L6R41_008342 [Letrouitia leprolyta]|nr:MAG: hypothetical protein L6R41_008342 [Letrouitia leprolyta]